jgi:hypothetical protein
MLSDWKFNDKRPLKPYCHDEFTLYTGGGAEAWVVKIFGQDEYDGKTGFQVKRNGVNLNVSDSDAVNGMWPKLMARRSFTGSPRMPANKHAITELSIPVLAGGFSLEVSSPGPKEDCEIRTKPSNLVKGLLRTEGGSVLTPTTEPTILKSSPSFPRIGDEVTIIGVGFKATQNGDLAHQRAKVMVGDSNAEVISWSDTKIVVRAPKIVVDGRVQYIQPIHVELADGKKTNSLILQQNPGDVCRVVKGRHVNETAMRIMTRSLRNASNATNTTIDIPETNLPLTDDINGTMTCGEALDNWCAPNVMNTTQVYKANHEQVCSSVQVQKIQDRQDAEGARETHETALQSIPDTSLTEEGLVDAEPISAPTDHCGEQEEFKGGKADPSQSLLKEDLLAFLPLNGNGLDSSGYNHPAVLTGNASWALGPFDKMAAQLSGKKGQHLEIMKSEGFWSANSARTIAMWINPSTTDKSMGIFDTGWNSITGSLRLETGGSLRLHLGKGCYATTMDAPVESNTWTHVALVQSHDDRKIFVNGAMQTLEKSDEDYACNFRNATWSKAFGKIRIGEGVPKRTFSGSIAMVGMWRRVLEKKELESEMHAKIVTAEGLTPAEMEEEQRINAENDALDTEAREEEKLAEKKELLKEKEDEEIALMEKGNIHKHVKG